MDTGAHRTEAHTDEERRPQRDPDELHSVLQHVAPLDLVTTRQKLVDDRRQRQACSADDEKQRFRCENLTAKADQICEPRDRIEHVQQPFVKAHAGVDALVEKKDVVGYQKRRERTPGSEEGELAPVRDMPEGERGEERCQNAAEPHDGGESRLVSRVGRASELLGRFPTEEPEWAIDDLGGEDDREDDEERTRYCQGPDPQLIAERRAHAEAGTGTLISQRYSGRGMSSMRAGILAAMLLVVVACAATVRSGAIDMTVGAVVETRPVSHSGDAADDPAIWVNSRAPARSLVIGTDKLGGVAVYDLEGKQLQYRPDGAVNNVDLRTGFRLGGKQIVLVTASDRRDDSIRIYRLDTVTRRLVDIAATHREAIDGIYGLCMYRSPAGQYHVFATQSNTGVVVQFRLVATKAGRVALRQVRTFDVGDSTEGCVADDTLGHLYVSEEFSAIWRYRIGSSDRTLVDSAGEGRLTADIEGLALARRAGGAGYLVASSQGSNSFAVYRRGGDNAYVGRFRVVDHGQVDGVTETDGIEIVTASLGRSFPGGMFVAQDDVNPGANQNFKLVRWDEIASALGIPG